MTNISRAKQDQLYSMEQINTDLDYDICSYFDITMDEVDSMPIPVLNYLRVMFLNKK